MKPFPSTLIISSSTQIASKEINNICSLLNNLPNSNNPDIFIIGPETEWGIDQIRSIKHFLSQKPFNHQNKIVIVQDAHNLNTESQNALLKTLEEPGLNNYIILTTNHISSLLSTIISRCHIIKKNPNLPAKASATAGPLLKITNNIPQNLITSESLSKNKIEVLPLLQEQLQLQQQSLITKPSVETAQTIKKLIKSIQMINANVDPKSALDFYFLN